MLNKTEFSLRITFGCLKASLEEAVSEDVGARKPWAFCLLALNQNFAEG